MDNETHIQLQLEAPPKASKRVIQSRGGTSSHFAHSSALDWPECWVVSSVVMRLCSVLHLLIKHCDSDFRKRACRSLSASSQLPYGASFQAIQSLLESCGRVPDTVNISVERGLFAINALAAYHFAVMARGPRCVTGGVPLISLVLSSTPENGRPSPLRIQLGIDDPLDSDKGLHSYRKFLGEVTERSNCAMQLRGQAGSTEHDESPPASSSGLLHQIWKLLAAGVATIVGDSNIIYHEFVLCSPFHKCVLDLNGIGGHHTPPSYLLSRIGQLLAQDARVSETSLPSGNFPKALVLSSRALGVHGLSLCYIVGTLLNTCMRLFFNVVPSLEELRVAHGRGSVRSKWLLENALLVQQDEQSAFYCPDLLLMLQEIRLEFQFPQRSFPVLEFFQKAVHDVPLRLQQLAVGDFGDVDVYTRIVAHWGPSLRVEMESGAQHSVRKGTANCVAQEENEGPLRVLFRVVRALYTRVFPGRDVPLIALRAPTSRSALDFLLYSWFMAPPQVRCFEIDARGARLASLRREEVHHLGDFIIRAMLFYDFCGQRVLFAETHATTVDEAVRRVNELAVSLNIPKCDKFPLRSEQRISRNTTGAAAIGYRAASTTCIDSEVAVLLEALTATTRVQPRLCFVGTSDAASPFVEGVVEVLVPHYSIRATAVVKKSYGIIPSLVVACRQALKEFFSVVTDVAPSAIESSLQRAADAAPLIPRDGFPHFDARFYTPTNLLGELLQGVVCRYDCTYTVDTHTREIVCCVHIPSIAGHVNFAQENSSFPLGIGRGSTKRRAWAAAAFQALSSNFFDFQSQVDRHKLLCELLLRPGDLFALGYTAGFSVGVTRRGVENSGRFECTIGPSQAATSAERGEGVSGAVITCGADNAAYAYISAVDTLLSSLQKRDARYRGHCVGSGCGEFTSWDITSNYAKSVWHACCGAVGVALGGKIALSYEGGCGERAGWGKDAQITIRLVARTMAFGKGDKETNNEDKDTMRYRITETGLISLHERRIREYSQLNQENHDRLISGKQIVFASTRLLAEAVEKYAGEYTKKELEQLLTLLQWRRRELEACPRLNTRRRIELLTELTLGCQSRVVVGPFANCGVTAHLGAWLPGYDRGSRVPIVISTCSARATECALQDLQHEADAVLGSLWSIVARACRH
uniref:Uncharacterized protein TCIL3000_7_5320 n=1 Tax=Trypanosoma congolense (strain IL3000) TaxID=1068625 RepID=G0UQQ7_TRYCI|nr:unnamed protein product [Trypanosoma congolense IL3000]